MTLRRAVSSARNVGIVTMIAAFAGVSLWLLVPALKSSSGSPVGNASAAHPSSLALWRLDPAQLNGSSGSTARNADAARGSPLKADGAARIESHDDIVTRLVVTVSTRGDQGVTFNDSFGHLSAETAMSETGAAVVPGTYTLTWLDGNGDRTLDPGEHAELTVDLPAVSTIHPGNPLSLVIKPAGVTLVIENVLGN